MALTPVTNLRSEPKFASPAEVEKLLESLDPKFVKCRARQHNWDDYTAKWQYDGIHLEVTERCLRCGSFRKFTMDDRGAREGKGNSYDYADGYLTKGLGRITGESRDLLRLHAIRQAYVLTGTRRPRSKKAGPVELEHRQAS